MASLYHRTSRSTRSYGYGRSPCRLRAVTCCLPLFILSCVIVNIAFILLWYHRSQSDSSSSLFSPSSSSSSSRTTTTSEQQHSNDDINDNNDNDDVVVIRHVVSLIKCTRVASVTGFLDAAAVLRHSIHVQFSKSSKYDYDMHAIVHDQCLHHAPLLKQLGYTAHVVPSPVTVQELPDGWYRSHVEGENCCGIAEFIKLYAYTLTEFPIVVHWDLDAILLRPMDDIFDSMLLQLDDVNKSNNAERQEAAAAVQARQRRKLPLQFPHTPLPTDIRAMFTRDVTSSIPWHDRQVVQGGFLVVKPNVTVFQKYVEIIKAANYTSSRGRPGIGGWDNLGYGGFQGSMAYQGLVAYYYDVVEPHAAVELDVCKWNQVVADVLWRGPARMDDYHGQCRQYQQLQQNNSCDDCRITPVEETYSVHFTACRKPWECTLPHPRKTRNPAQQYRVNNLTNQTTCGLLFREWFAYRKELEQWLHVRAGIVPSLSLMNNNDTTKLSSSYEPNSFLGYCKGQGRYIAMNLPTITTDGGDDANGGGFDISKVYGRTKRRRTNPSEMQTLQ